jgi:hypothetical protein
MSTGGDEGRVAMTSPDPAAYDRRLGDWLGFDFDVIAICAWCGHNRTITVEEAVRRCGPDATVRQYFGRLRCRFCGMPPGFQISYHRSSRKAGGK